MLLDLFGVTAMNKTSWSELAAIYNVGSFIFVALVLLIKRAKTRSDQVIKQSYYDFNI